MSAIGGPNIVDDSLVFYYDTFNQLKSYRGEPTVNYITTMASAIGGNTSLTYPETVYISTALETNVTDPSAPGGQYSRFTGNTDSANNQLYTRFNSAGIDVRNTTITYSVYLKGSGTCHLTIYADNTGYGTSPTITLTDQWTRYSYTRAVTNYTTNCWVAVRGLYTTTNVYVAAQQSELKSHATPFVNGTRSATQGLIDLTGNSTIDLTNVSFDSNAQMTFDGTTDYVTVPHNTAHSFTGDFSIEIVFKPTGNTANCLIQKGSGNDYFQEYWVLCDTRSSNRQFELIMGKVGNTSANYNVNASNSVTIGQYHHIVTGVQGSTGFMYVNGELIDTGAVIDRIQSTSDIRIGERVDGFADSLGDQPLTKIYNRALTASEVKSNFNAIKGRYNL